MGMGGEQPPYKKEDFFVKVSLREKMKKIFFAKYFFFRNMAVNIASNIFICVEDI